MRCPNYVEAITTSDITGGGYLYKFTDLFEFYISHSLEESSYI